MPISSPRAALRGFRTVPLESEDDNIVLLSQAMLQLQEMMRMHPLPVVSKSAAYTMVDQDLMVLADATSSAFTVTLPSAKGREGKRAIVKKTDSSANVVRLASNDGVQKLENTLTLTLTAQFSCKEMVSDLNNWHIVGLV